jgi:hypothetical protein
VTIEPFIPYISIIGTSLVFKPTSVLNVGDFSIFIVLTDSQNAITKNSFNFKVRSRPYFVEKLTKMLNIIVNNQMKYLLPISGNIDEFVTHDSTLPNFIKFTFPEYFF